jgi:hypothetical protein
MKRITIIAAIALVALTSCTKEQDYLCTIENTDPEGIVWYHKATVPFHGTYAQMKSYEAARTFGTLYSLAGPAQLTACK